MNAATAVGTMQAVVQRQYGTEPENVLHVEEIAVPAIGDDEVLVQVRAAGVDRGTWHLMAGMPYLARMIFGLRAPKTPVPGLAVAGTVAAIGSNVTGLALGDEVFGTANGAFAEYAVSESNKLAPKPANLTFEQAAAVPVSANTALEAVRKAKVQPGNRVLVVGASGGVGSWAVQIAKAIGAEVTGVASTAKVDFVRGLGATHILDYTREDFTDGVRQYDVILDIAGNRRVSALRRALTPNGRLVITGGEDGGRLSGGIGRNLYAQLLSLVVRQTLGAFVSRQRQCDLMALKEQIESGAIAPAIDRTYPLAEAAAAIRYLADGHARGKVVLTV